MRRDSSRARRSRRGVALLFAVLTVFGAAAMASVMLSLAFSADKQVDVEVGRQQSLYRAEGALQSAKKQLQQMVANWETPPPSIVVNVDGVDVTVLIEPTGFHDVTADGAGIQTIVDGYQLAAQADVGGYVSEVNRISNMNATPIFQYAVFYDGDLEILPGPPMTLYGRIRTNGDMYLGCDNSLTLNSNHVWALGDILRHRKNDPSVSTGDVYIRQWVSNPFDPAEPLSMVKMHNKAQLAAAGPSSFSGYDSLFDKGYDLNGNGIFTDLGDFLPFVEGSATYWAEPAGYTGGSDTTVKTGQTGVTEAVVPEVASVAAFEPAAGGDFDLVQGQYVQVPAGSGDYDKGYFHAAADLSVIGKKDGTWKAYDKSGADISTALNGAVTVQQIYNKFQAGASSAKNYVVDIDMAKVNASGKFPTNGLMYATMQGIGTGTSAHGVKLSKASELKNKLTVVSEGPVYLQGDYNTVSPKGCAVIGDTVNLLSNSWNGSKTKGTLPSASPTTYNVAMIAGNTTTSVGSYNGGLENLPKFHENWSGKKCAIEGSFVNAWPAQYANGNWMINGDYYTPPQRDWKYDTDFNNVANLPPFTPMIVSADDVVTW